jgi:hypothetical protein
LAFRLSVTSRERVIRQAPVLHRGLLLVHARLRPFALSLLTRDPGLTLSPHGAILSLSGRVTMGIGRRSTTLLQLSLFLPQSCLLPDPGQQEQQRNQHHDHDDDHHDQCS